MKVSVNIQPLLHSGKSGIGFYEHELLLKMIEDKRLDVTLQCFVIRNKSEKAVFYNQYLKNGATLNDCNWFSASLYQLLWLFFPLPYRLFFNNKTDITHFFNYYVPPFARGKKVVVVYDTVIKDYPETMNNRTRFMLNMTMNKSLKRADRIITISEFSKERIIENYGINESKIDIVPCGIDFNTFRKIEDKQLIETIKQKYKITGDFFLYLGTLEPRKNIVRLIEAYSSASKECTFFPKLVIAGGKGWLYESIFEKVNELGFQDSIVFTGYVEDGDVPILMNAAKAFCFPSLYEGFGMPPLEAMACGTPVLTSRCASMPEVVGDCGLLVDPYSVKDISEGLIRLATDDHLCEVLSTKGLERSRIFSWEKSENVLYKVYENILNY